MEKVSNTSSRGSCRKYLVLAPWQASRMTGVVFSQSQGPRTKPENVGFRASVPNTPRAPKSTFCALHLDVDFALISGSRNITQNDTFGERPGGSQIAKTVYSGSSPNDVQKHSKTEPGRGECDVTFTQLSSEIALQGFGTGLPGGSPNRTF